MPISSSKAVTLLKIVEIDVSLCLPVPTSNKEEGKSQLSQIEKISDRVIGRQSEMQSDQDSDAIDWYAIGTELGRRIASEHSRGVLSKLEMVEYIRKQVAEVLKDSNLPKSCKKVEKNSQILKAKILSQNH